MARYTLDIYECSHDWVGVQFNCLNIISIIGHDNAIQYKVPDRAQKVDDESGDENGGEEIFTKVDDD